jgi:hypothetical protein
MKTFHCNACQALVFFENTRCLTCGHVLAFDPGRMSVVSLEQRDEGTWLAVGKDTSPGPVYRLCTNYTDHGVCNWAIPADSPDSLCTACALTHTIPDLTVAGNKDAWLKLETAKRRLLFDLLSLKLPWMSKRIDAERGLEFDFLNDVVTANGDRSRVLTGHDNGLITINIAEADDLHREAQRLRHREPYRTILGHFRHEIGHYYWDRLIQGTQRLESFRGLFGDERADYQAALTVHYERGAPANWADNFISAYASTHPWEDWAESWAHVMHMVDALDTAQAVGLSVRPSRGDEPSLRVPAKPAQERIGDFSQLVSEWQALTYVLNNLTRGLGLADAYPFVLCGPVIAKLQFVCSAMIDAAGPKADAQDTLIAA